MNNSDLSSIREQLLALQHESKPEADHDSEVWEASRSPSLPSPSMLGVGAAPSSRAEVTQALRQRSTPPSRPPSPEEMAASASTIPTNINNCLRRLQDEAERINELYRQQEQAIQKFQRTAKGLDFVLLRQGDGVGVQSEQFYELRSAALTMVSQDKSGRYVLTAVDIDLNQDEQQAYQDAAGVRAFRQTRRRSPRRWASLRARLTEPMAMLEGLWFTLTSTLENRTQITPLDILVWCGGGVIGRIALELLLAAMPGLWPWLVAITIGAVAFGLYRLLFSSRPDITFIARLFLALLGLVIGGQI